ncbi:hypothetical protein BJ912DRAFT_960817 [Pholiota molesta]|nr:hypothetical protein BJ912DRAFT_960817 [Pholiota molesta]
MILDVKSWCWMCLSLAVSIPGGGIVSFGPLIIRGFGFSGDTVMLLLMPYGVLQLLWLALAFWANKRFKTKWPILVLVMVPCLTAAVILLRTGRTKADQPLLLFAYYLLSTFNVATPTIVNWQSSNVAGQTKKTATNAFMMMGLISGSISDKPYYHRGLKTMIICFGVSVVIVLGPKRRMLEAKRENVDYSMLNATSAEEEHAKDVNSDTGKHAFEDLTDLENDEFIVCFVCCLFISEY